VYLNDHSGPEAIDTEGQIEDSGIFRTEEDSHIHASVRVDLSCVLVTH
jgi:hypothetical protein